MSIRNVILLIGVLLLLVFAGANWQQFTAAVQLDLIFQQYEAPFGLVMLGVLAVFGALFLVSVGGIETSALKRKLQASKKIEKAQEALAETEANRFAQLEKTLRDGLESVETKIDRLADLLESKA